MSNMSYCRFRNTSKDLRDCEDALEELLDGGDKLSAEELSAAKRLVESCLHIVEMVSDRANLDFDILTPNNIRATLEEANEGESNAEGD